MAGESVGVSEVKGPRTWVEGNRKTSRAPMKPDVKQWSEQLPAYRDTCPEVGDELRDSGLAKPRATCGKPVQATVRTRRGARKGPPPYIRIGVRP
ncbi:hypothetical protein GCM10027456_45160 [Kineosporia babensis]